MRYFWEVATKFQCVNGRGKGTSMVTGEALTLETARMDADEVLEKMFADGAQTVSVEITRLDAGKVEG